MKAANFIIKENIPIAAGFCRMELEGDVSDISRPGQFVNIALPGRFLRRPISVHDWDAERGRLTLVYKILGQGTADMSQMKPGRVLELLTGLGNGFDTGRSGKTPLLVGGGAGVAPLYGLAKALVEEEKQPIAILGFNSAPEVFGEKELQEMGIPVYVTTADGSYGVKGFVTALLPKLRYSFFYACGPDPMERALYGATACAGEFSLEARMGCGFGACMGCSIETKAGNLRICKDGPVFDRELLLW